MNRMAREAQRRGFQGLVRVPGAVVLGAWVVLFLGSFGVAALMDMAADRTATVRGRARLVDELSPQPPFSLDDLLGPDSVRRAARPGEPDPVESLADSRARRLEEAVRAERLMVTFAVTAELAWLLAFLFVTVGTWRWVTARDGWVGVQSWHGGKLLMLYVPFTAAAALFAFSATASLDDEAGAVIFVTTALLLFTCATMLVRATWNWFTGRETQRKAVGDHAGPKPPRVPRP